MIAGHYISDVENDREIFLVTGVWLIILITCDCVKRTAGDVRICSMRKERVREQMR